MSSRPDGGRQAVVYPLGTGEIVAVDEALKEAGFTVGIGVNPSAVRVITSRGSVSSPATDPQAINAQARQLRSIVSARPALSDARLSA